MKEENFWNNVKKYLKVKGKNLKLMCDECFLNYGTVKNQKSMHKIPDYYEMAKISEYLGVDIYLLFKDEDQKEFPDDIQNIAVRLAMLPEEKRAPLIYMINGQLDYFMKK